VTISPLLGVGKTNVSTAVNTDRRMHLWKDLVPWSLSSTVPNIVIELIFSIV